MPIIYKKITINYYKRIFDLLIVVPASLMLILPLLIIGLIIKCESKGPILYWSNRVGHDSDIFSMPKFRSMKVNTPELATNLLKDPDIYLTRVGRVLRKTSLDELPQIWSILKGDMSLVGPRPALFNQDTLIQMRSERGIDSLVPGITGWAQVNGRDELNDFEKVKLDEEYLRRCSLLFDTKILLLTFLRVISRNGITH